MRVESSTSVSHPTRRGSQVMRPTSTNGASGVAQVTPQLAFEASTHRCTVK